MVVMLELLFINIESDRARGSRPAATASMTNVRPETRCLLCRNHVSHPDPSQSICLPNHQLTLTSLLHTVLDHTIAVHLGRSPPAHVFTACFACRFTAQRP